MSNGAPVFLHEPTIHVISRPSFSEPPHLAVQRVGESTDGERLAEFAGRLTHMSQLNPAERSTREYLEIIRTLEQQNALHHACYSLLIEGVSRSLVQEMAVLHTNLAFSPSSQGSNDETDARFVMPPAIIGDTALEAVWMKQIEASLTTHSQLVDQLLRRYAWVDSKVQRRRLARDAARGVLPGSTESRVVITGNAHAWRTLLELRAGEAAELEIRRLSVAVLRVMQAEAPALFSDFEVYLASDRQEAVRVRTHAA